MFWKKIKSTYINKHPYFTARHDVCEMPNGKIVDPYFVVEMPRSACAVAITENNEVVMIKQYRHPIEQIVYELPGGFIDFNEDVTEAIKRELLEETGYQFTEAIYLGAVAGNPGVLNNFTDMFLLKGGIKITEQKLDDNEEIEIVLFSIEEVKKMLQQNKILQALHVSCLYYALHKIII